MKTSSTLLGFFVLAPVALAQPSSGSAWTGEFAAGYSLSSGSALERNGPVGEAEINHFDFGYSARTSLSPDLRLFASLQWSREDLGLSGNVPLPEQLQSLRLGAGVVKDLRPGWKVNVMLAPGVGGESTGFSSSEFNLGGAVIFLRDVTKEFAWSLGLAGSVRGEYPVLPVLGLRWNWVPDWTLALGFPNTAVTYQATTDLTLKFGVGGQGGSYYVDRARAPGLGDTYLHFREIRAGLTATYSFNGFMSLEMEAGSVVDRRFDYYDRDYVLKGDSASYFNLGLRYRY